MGITSRERALECLYKLHSLKKGKVSEASEIPEVKKYNFSVLSHLVKMGVVIKYRNEQNRKVWEWTGTAPDYKMAEDAMDEKRRADRENHNRKKSIIENQISANVDSEQEINQAKIERYLQRLTLLKDAYEEPNPVKPLEYLEGRYNNYLRMHSAVQKLKLILFEDGKYRWGGQESLSMSFSKKFIIIMNTESSKNTDKDLKQSLKKRVGEIIATVTNALADLEKLLD